MVVLTLVEKTPSIYILTGHPRTQTDIHQNTGGFPLEFMLT